MSLDTISILDGNQFVVSDRRGDLEASPTDTHGLFLDDTRFLSRWVLTINGLRPTLLSVDEQEYFSVQFFMALATGTVYVDSHLSVVRRRAIERGFHEDSSWSITTRNPWISRSGSRPTPISPTSSRSRTSWQRRARLPSRSTTARSSSGTPVRA